MGSFKYGDTNKCLEFTIALFLSFTGILSPSLDGKCSAEPATGTVVRFNDGFVVFPRHPPRIGMPTPDFVRILNRRLNLNSSGRYHSGDHLVTPNPTEGLLEQSTLSSFSEPDNAYEDEDFQPASEDFIQHPVPDNDREKVEEQPFSEDTLERPILDTARQQKQLPQSQNPSEPEDLIQHQIPEKHIENIPEQLASDDLIEPELPENIPEAQDEDSGLDADLKAGESQDSEIGELSGDAGLRRFLVLLAQHSESQNNKNTPQNPPIPKETDSRLGKAFFIPTFQLSTPTNTSTTKAPPTTTQPQEEIQVPQIFFDPVIPNKTTTGPPPFRSPSTEKGSETGRPGKILTGNGIRPSSFGTAGNMFNGIIKAVKETSDIVGSAFRDLASRILKFPSRKLAAYSGPVYQ